MRCLPADRAQRIDEYMDFVVPLIEQKVHTAFLEPGLDGQDHGIVLIVGGAQGSFQLIETDAARIPDRLKGIGDAWPLK
jgi:hypothetical protein